MTGEGEQAGAADDARTSERSIVRDARFVRLPADELISVVRGAKVDISIIVEALDPIGKVLKFGAAQKLVSDTIRMEPSFSEVARIVTDAETAYVGAMNLVARLIVSGEIGQDRLKREISSLLDTIGTPLGEP